MSIKVLVLLVSNWQTDHNTGPCCAGSEIVSKLATKVRPRYHICGGKDVFYARQPYLNKDLGAGCHLSRLLLLALYQLPIPQTLCKPSAHHPYAWAVTSMFCGVPNCSLRYDTWLSDLLHMGHSSVMAFQPCPSLEL